MKKLIQPILIVLAVLICIEINAQTNRHYTKKSLTYQVNYQRMDAGGAHTLQIRGGNLFACGDNQFGQLGDGTKDNRKSFVSIKGNDNKMWVSVSCGANHSLGIKSDGTLWAWGDNQFGQLGDGTKTIRTQPKQIGTDNNWISIDGGKEHSLALKSDGSIWAWGKNSNSQLGDNTTTERLSPVKISSNSRFVSISAGGNFSFGLTTDGKLFAWGQNNAFQLGDGTDINRKIPVQIGNDSIWVSISCGGDHSLALKADGSLWAWGWNQQGQLGDGSNTDRNSPRQIGSDTKWVCIATGQRHSFGLQSDGTLRAWGENSDGELGDEGTTNQKTPVKIGSDKWVGITAGQWYSLGLQADGTLWAWGNNSKGQLGDGTTNTTPRSSPVKISTNPNSWLNIDAGKNYSVGIKTDGTLWTWGRNDFGQLGTANQDNKKIPVKISPVTVGKDTQWTEVAAGFQHSLGIQSDGTLWGTGDNEYGQVGAIPYKVLYTFFVKVNDDNDWSSVDAGFGHTVALKSDGSLWTWGYNQFGQLGDGNHPANRNMPNPVGADHDWVAVAAGSNHNLALKADGTLWAWGDNSEGQLGDGSQDMRISPVKISKNSNWISIAAGGQFSLAIRSDGTLWAWGRNNSSQLGDGSTTRRTNPIQIGSDAKWTSIAAGSEHSLGIQSDGTLWTWGKNSSGQLGDGRTDIRKKPFQIGTEKRWISISGGGDHSLALKSDRGGFCATGYNEYGQLGNNQTQRETEFVGYLDPFILLARYKIDLDSNSTIMARGLGATDTLGVITIRNNSTVSDSSSFARAVSISVNTGASLISKINLPATAGFPEFKNDTLSAKANDHTVTAGTTVTLTDSVYKNLNIGSNAIVTFSRPVIYVNEFSTGPGVTLKFSNCSELRIVGKTTIGSNNQFNPDSKGLIIYSTGPVTIDKGTTANVSVYSLDKISISGSASARVNMKGLFLANEIESKHTTWDWNYFDVCESALVSVKRIVKNDIGFKVFPNPNEGRFRIELNSTISAPLQISITDYLGREVYQTSQPVFSGSTSMEIDLNHFLSSCYILKVKMGDQTFYKKIMIVK